MTRALKALRSRLRHVARTGDPADICEVADAIDQAHAAGHIDTEMRGNLHVAALAAGRVNDARVELGHAAARFELAMEDCLPESDSTASARASPGIESGVCIVPVRQDVM